MDYSFYYISAYSGLIKKSEYKSIREMLRDFYAHNYMPDCEIIRELWL